MPSVDFTFNATTLINGAITVSVIVAAVFVLQRIVKHVLHRMVTARLPRRRRETRQHLAARSDTLSRALTQAVSAIIWVIAIMMILSELGVNIGPLLASLGLASLALGFAAQGIIRDYLHGVYILMEDWYRVGEVAILAGIGGLVVDISLRRTVLRDLDGTMHSIPNSKIEMASNLTRDFSRVHMNIGVAYGENLDRVIEVINEVCVQLKEDEKWGPDLLTTPKVERVDKLGDSAVEIKLLGDTRPMRQWGLMGELRKRIKDRFDEEGIEIPWPHTKVYFGEGPVGVGHVPVGRP